MGESSVGQCTNERNSGYPYLDRVENESELNEFLRDFIFHGYEVDSFHFLRNLGIIRKSAYCSHCNIIMTRHPSESVDLFKWMCQRCGKISSIRQYSPLENINCSYDKILAALVDWCDSEELQETAIKFEMEPTTVAKIFSLAGQAAEKHILRHAAEWKIGGPGVIVLIDTFPDKRPDNRPILCLAEIQDSPLKILFHPLLTEGEGKKLELNYHSFIRDFVHPESIVVAKKKADFGSFIDISLNHPQFNVLTSDEVLLRHESRGRNLHTIWSIIWEQAFNICMEAQFYSYPLMQSFLFSHMWTSKFRSRSKSEICKAIANMAMDMRESDQPPS